MTNLNTLSEKLFSLGSSYSIIQASNNVPKGNFLNYQGQSYQAIEDVKSGDSLLLVNGKAIPSSLVAGDQLSSRTVLDRKTRKSGRRLKKIDCIGVAWLVAETVADKVQFNVYGLTPQPILLFEEDDSETPFIFGLETRFLNESPGSFISPTEVNGGGTFFKWDSIRTNQSWSAVGEAVCSHTGNGESVPQIGGSSQLTLFYRADGSTESAIASTFGQGLFGTDTEGFTASGWGGATTAWVFDSGVGTSGSIPRSVTASTSGTISYTLSGDAPLTYCGFVYRDEDNIHFIVKHGILPGTYSVSGTEFVENTETNSFTFYQALLSSGIFGVNLITATDDAFIPFDACIFDRLKHFRYSIESQKIVESNDYDASSLPAKPADIIPTTVWSSAIPPNWQWKNDDGTGNPLVNLDSSTPGQLTCLSRQYLQGNVYNSRYDEWGFRAGYVPTITRNVQKVNNTYFYTTLRANVLEQASLPTSQAIDNVFSIDDLRQANQATLDSDGASSCPFVNYEVPNTSETVTVNPTTGEGRAFNNLKTCISKNSRPIINTLDSATGVTTFRLGAVPILKL